LLELLTVSHSDLPPIHVACLSVVNMQVTLLEDGNKEVALTIKGLTEYGYLLAVTHKALLLRCIQMAIGTASSAVDVSLLGKSWSWLNALFCCSLDFFQGLIRHKLPS